MRDRFLIAAIGIVVGLFFAGHHAHARSALELEARLGNQVLLANQKNSVFLKVSLLGREAGEAKRRPAVNICLAIDRSGSMAGEKLAQARAGAIAALGRLAPEDTVAVVAYDDTVDVLVPSSSASARRTIVDGIASLQAGGSTALYSGVAKCAEEVRRHLNPDRVNRIILLSDGQANVGPSSPAALGMLGAQLMEEGISVSTVGLGLDYNEDLMTELALRSDGRHVFVQRAGELTAFLDAELSSVTSVVATNVDVLVRCRGGVRPLRVLGRPADIVGARARTVFGKIYAGREHFLVIELEVPASAANGALPLADVDVSYRDLVAGHTETQSVSPSARFSKNARDVGGHVDPKVMGVVELALADLASERALALRDQGQIEAARNVLNENAVRLEQKAKEYNDPRLNKVQIRQSTGAKSMPSSKAEWNVQRKIMKKDVSDNPLEGL